MSSHPNEDGSVELAHHFEKGAHVAEEVAKNEGLRENIAQAVVSIRNFLPYKGLKLAWDLLPAKAQRLMITDHTSLGAFILKYIPMVHPESYFIPGQLAAGFIQCGLLDFKQTDEEIKAMEEALGVDASEAQKMAYWSEKQETELLPQIITPGEGYTEILDSKPAAAAAAVNPELEPLILIGKAGGMLKGAKDGFFESVRTRAHQLEVEAKEKEEVLAEEKREHDAVAADLRPEVQIPPANNTDHFDQAHRRAA